MNRFYASTASLLLCGTIAAGIALTRSQSPSAAFAQGTSSSFRMPAIAQPQANTSDCRTRQTIRATAGAAPVKGLCVAAGTMLVNARNVTGFVLSDVVARGYGPLLRGDTVPDLQVVRVSATAARADPVLGLGLVNVSNGIGKAVFRDLVWIGDPASPAVNDADAWAAIALKGKDANDTGTFEIRNFDFRNLTMAKGSNYQNVDGISTEGGYSGLIADGSVSNASDACLDIKGAVRVDNVRLEGCREGMKIWSDQKHGLIELGTNSFVGIIGKGSRNQRRRIEIDVLIVTGNPKVPLLRAEDGPVTLHIRRLVASSSQILNSTSSFAGSDVTVDQRVNN
ncbi:hypothetical protein AB3M93_13090 [Novosphingobium panipatense]|uniref:hypothetical protein n=1 Tax=Novosphingobium panipatense TaxID=428991 RepID=UPI0039A354FA